MKRRRLLQLAATIIPGFCATPCPASEIPSADRVDPELRAFLIESIADADSFDDRFDAQVWLLAMAQRLRDFVPDVEEGLSLLKNVHREATAAGLDPDLVLAVIEVESRFDRFAVSNAGAQGLMQVMPFWRDEIGRPNDNLTEIVTNLRYGCRILQFYMQSERGNLVRALARYNGSIDEYWYPERVIRIWKKRWLWGAL